MTAPIAILTDFGLSDPYVGIMKGVIMGIAPGIPIVDVSHGVPPQDLLVAALQLDAAVDYFPPGTLFLVVVDPGVGSERAVVAASIAGKRFVCPDNGVLSAVLERHPAAAIVRVQEPRLQLARPSRTFHGRDLMAPAAAHWQAGVPQGDLGPPQGELLRLPIPAAHTEGDLVVGEGLFADHFGNLVTSIRQQQLPRRGFVLVGPHRLPLVGTYADQPQGSALALVGSTGRLEISVNGGSAVLQLGISAGDAVLVQDLEA